VVADGAALLGPAAGDQACGEVGDGRMLEPEALRDALIAHFQPKRLAGSKVLVTAGPTYEAIDPVRGITNLSSGKMGFAVARAAAEAGASVTLVAGPVALATPAGVTRIDVRSARQMYDAVLPAASAHDVFVATAAVAALPKRPYCVGFAAESHDVEVHARAKLERKKVPLIVGNLGPATFGRDDNALLLVDAKGTRALPHADKLTLARQLITEIAQRLSA